MVQLWILIPSQEKKLPGSIKCPLLFGGLQETLPHNELWASL